MADTRNLIIFGVVFLMILLGLIGAMTTDYPNSDIDTIEHENTYINASSIVATGVTETAGNNISNLNELNGGFWSANENLSVPYTITIDFHNVTHFDTIEAVHKYNSSGAPSSHIITRYVWCETYKDFIALEEFSTENEWYYKTVQFSDTSHFIMANGTVRVKYVHPSNGIVAHKTFIDVCRLVRYENIIS